MSAPSIHELREILVKSGDHLSDLTAMLDELAQLRARDRLHTDVPSAVDTSDLPADAPTGLYLDRACDAEDLVWIKMAWDAYLRSGQDPRSWQLMLVFQAIRRDDRATQEFLHVMNAIVLPLLRRLRLKEQPGLVSLGAANE